MEVFIYLYVPGSFRPPELAPYARTKIPAGVDYWFERPQQAFDAADIFRSRNIPYELKMTPADRKPWETKKRFLTCFH